MHILASPCAEAVRILIVLDLFLIYPSSVRLAEALEAYETNQYSSTSFWAL